MTEPPDYRGDYTVTTAPRGAVRPVVSLFTSRQQKMNSDGGDYGSQTHACSQPVVAPNPLISNDLQPPLLLTTPLVSKEEYRRKDGVGKEYAREGGSVVVVTQHAIERLQQRVRPCSDDEARTCLSCRGILSAIEFGARLVKLGTGQRVILRGQTVVTVIPADRKTPAAMDRMTRGDRV